MVFERERTKEPEATAEGSYEATLRLAREKRERDFQGDCVVKGAELARAMTQLGSIARYYPQLTSPLQEWDVWLLEFEERTGKHLQQGGGVFFVVEGNGYSVLNGEKVLWKKGGLVLVPVQLGGVEVQHFNEGAGKAALCMFRHRMVKDALGSRTQHLEDSPEWERASRK